MDNLKLADEILNRAVDSLTKLDLERFGIIDNEYLIFIDESQKEGNRVLVAIIVPKSYWQYLRTIWDTGVRAINGNPAEYDLKHEKFRRRRKGRKSPLVAALLLNFSPCLGIKALAVARPGDWPVKNRPRNEEMLVEDLLERIVRLLRENGATGRIFVDKAGNNQEEVYTNALRKVGGETIIQFECVDSKGNPGIGLADIVAGTLSRYLITGKITGFLKLISLILVPWRGVALVKPVPTRTFFIHFNNPLKFPSYEKGNPN